VTRSLRDDGNCAQRLAHAGWGGRFNTVLNVQMERPDMALRMLALLHDDLSRGWCTICGSPSSAPICPRRTIMGLRLDARGCGCGAAPGGG
jgi:hypothetical protein